MQICLYERIPRRRKISFLELIFPHLWDAEISHKKLWGRSVSEITNRGIPWNYSISSSLFLPKDPELLPHTETEPGRGEISCNNTRGGSTLVLFTHSTWAVEAQMREGAAFHNSTLLFRGKLQARGNTLKSWCLHTLWALLCPIKP